MATTITPYDRLTAPVYPSVEALRMYEGPSTTRRYAIVDGSGLFRWYLGDTTADNGTTCIEPNGGGAVGRWKRTVAFAASELVDLVSGASVEAEADTLALRNTDGASAFAFIIGDERKRQVDYVIVENVALPSLPNSTLTGGSSLPAGQSVLLTGQSAPAQNGIYVNTAGSLVRRSDFDEAADIAIGSTVFAVSGGSTWRLSSPSEGATVIGTTPLEFSPVGRSHGLVDLGSVANEQTFDGLKYKALRLTATGSVNLTLTNLVVGETYSLSFVQDATGYRTLTVDGYVTSVANAFTVDPVPLSETHFSFTALSASAVAVPQSRADVSLFTEYEANEINRPSTNIAQMTAGSIRALDAQDVADQPDPLTISGGRPHSTLIGVDTNHNVIHHGGIGGTALNGEGGQLNFFGGDYRIPGCPPVLCGEIGYTWQFDYDLDPTSGLPRTPYALRLHSGVNPNTNSRTRLVLQGYDSLSMESQFSNVITTVTAGNAIQLFISTTSSGNGLLEDNVAGYVQLSGATPGTITIANRIPLTKLAHCDLTVVSKSTDYDSREVFRLKFTWFGTVIALIETVADVGGYPSSAGRVSLTDSGTSLVITCTGLADGRTRNVTARLRLEIQQ